MSTPPTSWDIAHVLAEPTRRLVFEVVRSARRPMSRDDVAAASGVNRRLTVFHLDRLAEAGLLAVDYARPEGRTGPGAGRPAKRYAATAVELDLSVPPRHYELAARLLAQAVSERPADAAARSMEVARDEGRRAGALRRPPGRVTSARRRETVRHALQDLGYEPGDEGADAVRLRNCPFHSVAGVAPELVCGMNREFVAGLLEGLGLDGAGASLDPSPPSCCVSVRA